MFLCQIQKVYEEISFGVEEILCFKEIFMFE